MDIDAFSKLSPTTFADVLTRDRVMDPGIRPLWGPMERLAGPAYTVACPAGDNLMLHVAIHRAPAGSVVVCAAGDANWAMAGGNVCAYAQQRGIAGFVVDGVIRDLAETRARRFPVFARGVIPIPGLRKTAGLIGVPVVATVCVEGLAYVNLDSLLQGAARFYALILLPSSLVVVCLAVTALPRIVTINLAVFAGLLVVAEAGAWMLTPGRPMIRGEPQATGASSFYVRDPAFGYVLAP